MKSARLFVRCGQGEVEKERFVVALSIHVPDGFVGQSVENFDMLEVITVSSSRTVSTGHMKRTSEKPDSRINGDLLNAEIEECIKNLYDIGSE